MGFQRLMLMQMMMLLEEILAAMAATALPGCPDHCGGVTIPYPFGTKKGCFYDEGFLITCNETSGVPMAYFGETQINVTEISLQGQMHILRFISKACYDKSGNLTSGSDFLLTLSKFTISSTQNKFTVVGCDSFGTVGGSQDENDQYSTGCTSTCDSMNYVVNGTCSGIGCCQTSIPEGGRFSDVTVSSFWNHRNIWNFNPCSYAFVVEEDKFNFSSSDLIDLQNVEKLPVVLDWTIGNNTCQVAQKNLTSYACKENSECVNAKNGFGYRCNCSKGYDGNPYLPYGCKDIDECETLKPCNGTCTNLPGSFSCSCQNGYEQVGTSCHLKGQSKGSTFIDIALGISISLLVLIVGSSWIYWIVKKRKLMKLREKFFQENGGLMLQQQLSKREGSLVTARIFTTEDLKKATNNYDESRVIGQGGYGTVYRGVLPDNKTVAIKKSKISDQSQVEQFINEVIVLSQINHRNVVKLLGCCLETQVPLLVYEFITNGTLSDHIHHEGHAASLSWGMRLKIAAETAGALAYLHSATSLPIIHRDIKSSNILLDDNYTTKVSDFGASRLVPVDHTQLTTLVQGTFGYLDPEYFFSSQLTEKSDVYSFGVLLAELLTGEKALSFDRPENDRNLAMYFVSSMKEERLFQILDDGVVKEGKFEQLKEVAKLARRCLRVKGEDRPTMKEVAMELEGLRMTEKHPWVIVDLYPEEAEHLLTENVPSDGYNNGVSIGDGCSTTAGYDSMRNQVVVPLDDGR